MDSQLAYERRKGETADAYEAARAYFELGAGRSLAGVSKKLSKNVGLLKRWSVRWDWVNRAIAWDEVMDKARDEAVRKALSTEAVRVAEEWATRENLVRQRMYDLHVRGLNKIDQMLGFPLATITTEVRKDPNGEMARFTTVNPARWSFDTVHRMAARMCALGLAAVRNTGATGGNEMEREENWMIDDYLEVPQVSPDDKSPDISPAADAQAPLPQPVNADEVVDKAG